MTIQKKPDFSGVHSRAWSIFAAQFIAESDVAAVERIEREAVQPICDGTLSPDTDFRSMWIRAWGGAMIKSAFS